MKYIDLIFRLKKNNLIIFSLRDIENLFPEENLKTLKNNFGRRVKKDLLIRLRRNLYELIEPGLNSIYKQKLGKYFYFMGGTAMRYLYRLPRFSEDLDFNTPSSGYQEFENVLERIGKDLSREGLSATISVSRRKKLYTAKLLFIDIMEKYGITDGRGVNLMIKIEINGPDRELNTDSKVLSMYGYSFIPILMSRGNLLSEKICALLNRKRGRDIYDTLYMLRKKFPFNENVLKANNIKLSAESTILAHLESMDEKELKQQADQVKPSLFEEDGINLIIKAPLSRKAFLDDYANDFEDNLK